MRYRENMSNSRPSRIISCYNIICPVHVSKRGTGQFSAKNCLLILMVVPMEYKGKGWRDMRRIQVIRCSTTVQQTSYYTFLVHRPLLRLVATIIVYRCELRLGGGTSRKSNCIWTLLAHCSVLWNREVANG